MRYPLITPLASRDGTVDKDEHLVNCFGEQDDETKETRVIKRAGLDEGNAVLTGPDIYGQGLFNYDGYWFAILGDTVFWYDINFTWGGQQAFGSVGFWDSGTTYNLNDPAYYNGLKYYSAINGNIGNAPPSQWSAAPLSITYATFDPASPFLIYGTLSNGNKTYSLNHSAIEWGGRATTSKTSGKWYFEFTVNSLPSGNVAGVGTSTSNYVFLTSADVGSVIGIAVHVGTGNTTTAYKNGVFDSSWTSDVVMRPTVGINKVGSITANFGSSVFAYSPPAGFNAGWYEVS